MSVTAYTISVMQPDRREFMQLVAAAAIAPSLGAQQEPHSMYGLISKMTVVPGKRDEVVAILKTATTSVPGCLSYVVATDASDETVLWITEVWDNAASHTASLSLPSVREAISSAKALITGGQKVAVTTPVLGVTTPRS